MEGKLEALKAPLGWPRSQGCTVLPSTDIEKTSSLPEALTSVAVVAATLSQTRAPANARAPPLSSPMRGVIPGPPLLNTRDWRGSLCAPPLLQFLWL